MRRSLLTPIWSPRRRWTTANHPLPPSTRPIPGGAGRIPEGDCSWTTGAGYVEIFAANGRDLWWTNFSAPRLVRTFDGDFSLQVRCEPADDQTPAIGGLLLWLDERNYLRLDRGSGGARRACVHGVHRRRKRGHWAWAAANGSGGTAAGPQGGGRGCNLSGGRMRLVHAWACRFSCWSGRPRACLLWGWSSGRSIWV